MAEDLLRYMEDRPIDARRASSFEHFIRWCRRNPALAISSSAALLLLLATAVISAFGYASTSSALAQANLEKVRAKHAKSVSEDARARAETTLAVAIEAFDSIFDNIGNRGELQSTDLEWDESNVLRFQTSLTDADAELLRSLLTFYGQFAKQNEADFNLINKTAAAHHRIAQIHQRLGHQEEAQKSFEDALKVYRDLHERFPTKPEYAVAVARVFNDRGVLLGGNAVPPFEVAQQHELAIDLLKALPADLKQVRSVRMELAKSLDLAGSVMPRRGMTNMGPPPPMPPGNRPNDGPRNRVGNRRPNFERMPGTPGPPPGDRNGVPELFALIQERLDESCEILEKLNNEEPSNAESRLLLAQAERHRYMHYSVSRNAQKAKLSFQRAMGLLERLVEDYPTTPKFLLELADTLASAGVPTELISPEDAESNLRQSMEYCFQLIKRFPNAPEYQALLASCFSNLARSEGRRSEWSLAQANYKQAFDRLEVLRNRFPFNDFYRINRMVAIGELAHAARMNSTQEASTQEMNAIVAMLENAVAESKNDSQTNDPFYHFAAGNLLKELADAYRFLGNEAKAEQALEQLQSQLENSPRRPR